MANILTEDEIEQKALQTLQEQGYELLHGTDMERQYHHDWDKKESVQAKMIADDFANAF